ncbi:hypothetical protein H0H93_010487 [Arthromyces matolae]|nr:hypothetical protein H0H93_010487 [Arthromyces matolae]
MTNTSAHHHVLPSFVRSFLDSKPPRLLWTKDLDARPELTFPSLFSERHLDAQVELRQVRIIPLEEFLSQVVDHTLISMADNGISLHKMGPDEVFTECPSEGNSDVANNAESVADAYLDATSKPCQVLVPSLLFHPRARKWSARCLHWKGMKVGRDSYAASLDCYGLHICPSHEISKNLRRFMDVETCERVDALNERYRSLAWWETFYVDEEIQSLFKEFEGIAAAREFKGACSTTGFRKPPAGIVTVTPDASNTPFVALISSSVVESSLANQPDAPMTSDKQSRLKQSSAVTATSRTSLPRRAKETRKKYPHANHARPKSHYDMSLWPEVRVENQRPRLLLTLFILRAWALSVNDDTTFMIFRFGNYERIGFRHRESQTLFLSNLIDIPNCNPTYNRIHTGLYLSIIQDALDRLMQQQVASEAKPRTRKRKRDSCDTGVIRSYKTRSKALKVVEEAHNFELLKHQVLARPLALITLRFGNYNSITPGAFLRSGASKKSSYRPDEYISLVLNSKIGYGAIGSIYHAHMELLVESRARSTTVVVKVASQEKDIEHLQHEYSIYEHLSRHGVVEGIPFVFGLFKDTESEVTVLVMNHVGTDLWHLRPDKTKEFVRVSKETEDAYTRILKSIHDANILHDDIHPQNLMMKGDTPTIIDFTHARLSFNAHAKEMEDLQLTELLHEEPYVRSARYSSGSSSSELEISEDEDKLPENEDGPVT